MRRLVSIATLIAALVSPAAAGPLQEAAAASDRGDHASALALLTPLADSGDVDALGNLGNMHAFGQGVPIDLKRAYDLWSRAADKHLGTAMYNIATLYFLGKPGFSKDEDAAAKWYLRAAQHRHAQAMLTTSSMYAMGRGLPLDKRHATAWASLTESNSSSPELKQAAVRQLRLLMSDQSPDEIKEAQALIGELAKAIDKNVQAYREQRAP